MPGRALIAALMFVAASAGAQSPSAGQPFRPPPQFTPPPDTKIPTPPAAITLTPPQEPPALSPAPQQERADIPRRNAASKLCSREGSSGKEIHLCD